MKFRRPSALVPVSMIAAVTMFVGVLAGCSTVTEPPPNKNEAGGISDINPRPVSDIRDGGNLRLALSALPDNWNTISADGNNAETTGLVRPTMPRAFDTDAAGRLTVNHNYFIDVKLTNTDPQQITYTINPKAVWSDGSPITWEDIKSQANALAGADQGFQIASTAGFDRVQSVDRGVDDRQAIITFKQHYAEWQGQFSGNSFLYPKRATETPEAFNKSLLNEPGLSSGPFMVTSIDRGQGRVVLSRNPRWWGAIPKLDHFTFTVLDSTATMPALQNGELDAVGLGSVADMKTAELTPNISIRRAPSTQFSVLLINGAKGSVLEDPRVRVAMAKAIDRKTIAQATQYGMVHDPHPLNNHVYVEGQAGYQDDAPKFDPAEAAKELDAAGWKLQDGVRVKDGRQLEIRDVMYSSDAWTQVALVIQHSLADIGVKLTLDPRPAAGLFTDVLPKGDFDFAQISFVGDAFPLSSLPQAFALNDGDIQNNFGRIGSPELNQLIDDTLSELDPKKAIEMANEVDRQVWAEGQWLPLVQSPGNMAVRSDLANYGPAGLASLDYTKIGFVR